MPPSTRERDLLFGLLALVNNLIDAPGLAAAFHVWTGNPSHRLGDILVARGALTEKKRTLIEGLTEAHLEAHGDDVVNSYAALMIPKEIKNRLRDAADEALVPSFHHVGQDHLKAEPDGKTRYVANEFKADSSPPGRFKKGAYHAKGGLGEVFHAEDVEVKRQVAWKQIQERFADDLNCRTRFEFEAQVTARLEHPGIVPVHGIGESPGDGRPYYVMRFLHADTLHQAIGNYHKTDAKSDSAEVRNMGLQKLLRHFTNVCNTIAYAHSRGVLHRDIKPANIMVGEYGETIVVDWGLAKLFGDPDSTIDPGAAPLVQVDPKIVKGGTRHGSFVGTPGYASPEQAAGKLEQVDARSDVYSLGATLYYLLTSRSPRAPIQSPRAMKPGIPEALETIYFKATALNPDDRHATPLELAADVESWLLTQLEVFQAQRDKAEREARKFEAINEFFVEGIFAQADPSRNPRNDKITVEQMLDRADAAFGDRFVNQPEIEAAIRNTIGLTYLKLGAYEKAEPHLQKALDANWSVLGEEHPDTLASLNNLALLLDSGGRYGDAEPLYRQALDAGRRVRGEEHPQTLTTLNNLALLLHSQGRYGDAEHLYRQALDARRRVLGEEHPQTLNTLNNLANLLNSQGRYGDAEPLYRQALDASRRVLGEVHPQTLTSLNNLVGLLESQGKLGEAEHLYRQTLDARRRVLDEEHPDIAMSLSLLGNLLNQSERATEAESVLREALAIRKRVLPPKHWLTAYSAGLLGESLKMQGKFAESEPLLLRSYADLREAEGVSAYVLGCAVVRLIELYQRWDRPEDAAHWRRVLNEDFLKEG